MPIFGEHYTWVTDIVRGPLHWTHGKGVSVVAQAIIVAQPATLCRWGTWLAAGPPLWA